MHRLMSFPRLIVFDKRRTGLSDAAAFLTTILALAAILGVTFRLLDGEDAR